MYFVTSTSHFLLVLLIKILKKEQFCEFSVCFLHLCLDTAFLLTALRQQFKAYTILQEVAGRSRPTKAQVGHQKLHIRPLFDAFFGHLVQIAQGLHKIFRLLLQLVEILIWFRKRF